MMNQVCSKSWVIGWRLAMTTLAAALSGCILNAPNHNITATGVVPTGVVPATPAAQPVATAARPTGPIQKVALSGTSQRVGVSYYVNPDCTSGGTPVLRLLTTPTHGNVTFETVDDFPEFPPKNQRYECNKKKVPMVAYIYKSASDFKGRDEFTVEAVYPRGEVFKHDYAVDVQ